MRVMGLDFGSKTVGVAISDPLFVTAQGIEIIRRKEENKLRHTLQRIEELIGEYEVGQIVLGLPKNMNATEGERVEKTKEFADKLARRTGLPVAFMDERLTTVAADRTMMEVGRAPGKPEGICGYDCSCADFTGISGQTADADRERTGELSFGKDYILPGGRGSR